MTGISIVSIIFMLLTLENVVNCVSSTQINTISNLRSEVEKYKCLVNQFNLTRFTYKKRRDLKVEQINLYNNLVLKLDSNKKCLEDNIRNQVSRIAVQNQNISRLNDDLNNKTIQLNNLNNTLKFKTNEFSASEKQIATINSTLYNRNETVNQKTKEIIALNMQIEEYKSVTQNNSVNLQANKKTILSLNENVTKTEEIIIKLNKKIEQFQLKSERDKNVIENLKAQAKGLLKCCQATSCEPFGISTDVHRIYVPNFGPLDVLCNGPVNGNGKLAGPGWTVIQRRLNGSVNFYRDWREYKHGFGSLQGEFFIGLEQLHHMTQEKRQELYIHLEDFDGETRYARYDNFQVGNLKELYALKSLGKYSGTAEDQMRLNEGQKFSTVDMDNDNDSTKNCALVFHGAWWYNNCGLSNLNGRYLVADTDYETMGEAVFWDSEWHDYDYSMKTVQMMIRAKE